MDVSNKENINFKYIDSLTGLFNRMAFDERMYEIKESNIVFGDDLSMKDILMLLYKDTFD